MEGDYNPRLALIEAETRYRQLTDDEPTQLQALLDEAEEKTVKLKQDIDRDIRAENSKKSEMLNHLRNSKFFQDKINQLDQGKLRADLVAIEQLRGEIAFKQAELRRLRKCLEEFEGTEPTELDMRQAIDKLKASRLSLEMTFVGDSP